MSGTSLAGLATAAQEEVARQMTVCNACRYCEGLCAVFPAMELRTSFDRGDVDYLANLCHHCGACYYDCQYAPPHEFAINVPAALATVREETYGRYARPRLPGVFERNGLWLALATALITALFLLGFAAAADPGLLFAAGGEPGAFYRVMPHGAMVLLFGGAALFALTAMAASARAFWRGTGGGKPGVPNLLRALHDAVTLRYLDGGGMGCMSETERPSDARRRHHHLTFYGFLLCFASTTSGTIAHYAFDWPAPYPWWSPTVILGTLGGIGLVIGPIGLLRLRQARDPALVPATRSGMDEAFLWMLLLTGGTGLVLLVLRATPLMGILLAIHLGVVLALFLALPYGKFVHAAHRLAALIRHAHEQRQAHAPSTAPEEPTAHPGVKADVP
jgi:citrate/tricarballylate utilization protein